MWLLYQLLLALVTVLAGPWFLLRRGPHYLASLRTRLGKVPLRTEPALWIHAVSVGEVNVAASLAPLLPPERPLVVTTVTPSGQEQARRKFPNATVTYLPFDMTFAVRKFFDRLQPEALIVCEGDLWPLVLRETKLRGVPAVVVNGRIGDTSFRRMKRIRRWLGSLLEPLHGFAVQTEADRKKLLELGFDSDRLAVTGNLKFETERAGELPELALAIRELAEGRPVIVAGSTMRGEEPHVMEAFDSLGGGDRALLVIAPRHPERWPRVAARLVQEGRSAVRRSELAPGKRAGRRADVLLLDSLGELASVYGLGSATFVGGTLVPTGGHNPLEAAHHGVAIAVGPSMHNFKEIAERFDAERAWARVSSPSNLAEIWEAWLDHPAQAAALGQRARDLVEANRGALEKTRAFLELHLGAGTVR